MKNCLKYQRPTATLLLSEEDVDGVGDDGCTGTEVVIEEKSRILIKFVHADAEDDVYIVKVNSVLKLNLVTNLLQLKFHFPSQQIVLNGGGRYRYVGFSGIRHVLGLETEKRKV